ISGEISALNVAEEASKELGVRRAIRLKVAGGFHSECMRPAANRLASALADVEMSEPKLPVISNVTAAPITSAGEIRSLLERQVCSPVLWEESIKWMLSQGHTSFLEPAPGKVLSGILRKINRDAICESADSPKTDEGAQTA
ncbi:MAG: ACP S-malonyltransferase, partial [Planctomycetota bacterium]|nr:ACP S-malonyltransferase [Planctomycetota bacterium]